jgi:hypothetical protein
VEESLMLKVISYTKFFILPSHYSFEYSGTIILPVHIYNLAIMNRTLGIILIVIGAVMLIWTGFSYTKREKVVDAGPIQISADKQKSVNWPPYTGGILFFGGVLLIATSKKTA